MCVASIRLACDGGTLDPIPVAVLEDSALHCCVLLGINCLRQQGIVVDFDQCEIQRKLDGTVMTLHEFEVTECCCHTITTKLLPLSLVTCTATEEDTNEKKI